MSDDNGTPHLPGDQALMIQGLSEFAAAVGRGEVAGLAIVALHARTGNPATWLHLDPRANAFTMRGAVRELEDRVKEGWITPAASTVEPDLVM